MLQCSVLPVNNERNIEEKLVGPKKYAFFYSIAQQTAFKLAAHCAADRKEYRKSEEQKKVDVGIVKIAKHFFTGKI